MTKNEIVGRLKDGGLDASSTNRSAAVYVADAMAGRAVPGWFAFRIVCGSEETERRARAILSRWYDIDANGNGVWRLKSKNRVPLMAIKRGSGPTPPPPTPTGDYMYFEAVEANSTVSMVSTLATAPNLEYSTDGETWQEWQHTTADNTHTFDTLTLTAVGDRVYLRGNNTALADDTELSTITMTGSIEAGGSVTSLLDNDGETLTTLPTNALCGLFGDFFNSNPNTALITAPSFGNVTEIGISSCVVMYSNCTALETAADMSNITTIGDDGCNHMYSNCTALATAADMGSVATFGERAIMSMYENVPDSTLFTIIGGQPALTFDFPALPVNVGATTLSTLANVYTYITHGSI